MPPFRFSIPVEIRYADIDAQGHVNSAKALTYMEQARAAYMTHLGLWDGRTFADIGIILAEAQIRYRSPILLHQPVVVWTRVNRLGNKSFDMEYRIVDASSGAEFAEGSTVIVCFDYRSGGTIPIPETWRAAFRVFENLD